MTMFHEIAKFSSVKFKQFPMNDRHTQNVKNMVETSEQQQVFNNSHKQLTYFFPG